MVTRRNVRVDNENNRCQYFGWGFVPTLTRALAVVLPLAAVAVLCVVIYASSASLASYPLSSCLYASVSHDPTEVKQQERGNLHVVGATIKLSIRFKIPNVERPKHRKRKLIVLAPLNHLIGPILMEEGDSRVNDVYHNYIRNFNNLKRPVTL
ncbi:hypothetical protein JHK87_056843 [Glycine soja]|nr:hypothetical protein JHK87_056843 [Glycine soja]